MGFTNMRPVLSSRFAKIMLMTAALVTAGGGVATHALAQKGNVINSVASDSSGFFSFNLGTRGVLLSALSAGLEAGAVDTLAFFDTQAMRDFYAAREGRTLWIDSRGSDHRAAKAVLASLEQAWTHGLNPAQYHVAEIRGLIAARQPIDKANLELLVTDAAVRYARDLNGFRLPAAAIGQNPAFWRVQAAAGDILTKLGGSDNPAGMLERFAPQDALYQKLREELAILSTSPDRSFEEFLPISTGNQLLRPGATAKAVINLRGRLGIAHDPAAGAEMKYDDTLAAAVMDFQRAHGLYADGVIGPQTLEALNRGVTARMEQVIANMERLRWLEDEKPDRYILVNIPAAMLWAVENNQVAFEMPVIVGRPQRQTASFVTEISGVRFNPKWTVPPTIKSKDFLPKLVEDPYYLIDKGIEVYQIVDGERYTIDSSEVDWAEVTREELRSMRMVQAAGDNNALGRFRVLMDNPYDIYLHDTNAPEYFKKPDRAASSGCIRLSEPEKVAEFILGPNQNWSTERMTRIVESGRTTEVSAEQKIPVYILYQTIWTDAEGELVYGPDIYKQDRRIIAAMDAGKHLHIPKADDLQLASTGTEASMR